MKKAEIAAQVFETVTPLPLTEIEGGPLTVPVDDIAGLSLIPWFCDASVQWAIRISLPGAVLKKSLIKKAPGAFITETATGALLIGIPGDGIEPSTYALSPLAAALSPALRHGMKLELATANLGIVKRDWQVKAETDTTHGNQRYAGTIDEEGRWVIEETSPGLSLDTLTVALDCGRMVAGNGPWTVRDKDEARAVLLEWLRSPQANINPAAVKRFITLTDGTFTNSDPGMIRKLCGLGLGFFRRRLSKGPYQWSEAGPQRHSDQEIEDVVRSVLGEAG